MLGFPPFLWVFDCFLVSSSSGGYLLEINIQSTFWQRTVIQDKIKSISKFTLIRSPCQSRCDARTTGNIKSHCLMPMLLQCNSKHFSVVMSDASCRKNGIFFNCVENFHSLQTDLLVKSLSEVKPVLKARNDTWMSTQ